MDSTQITKYEKQSNQPSYHQRGDRSASKDVLYTTIRQSTEQRSLQYSTKHENKRVCYFRQNTKMNESAIFDKTRK